LLDQLRTTLDAIRPTAIKIGMLASDDSVRNVLLALAPVGEARIVIDPVLASSDGTPLLEKRAYPALRDLMHRRCLITPNWPEAEILVDAALPRRRDGEEAARQLMKDLELEGVLLTGGHLEGDPDDLLVMRVGGPSSGEIVSEWLPGKRLPGPAVHGTGCALSSAIAAGLGKGQSLRDSIDAARNYVRRAIENAHTLHNGARILGFE
jgi:hydroxymethylpyrimidine/phosphomethylpyrimidine kinase